MSNAALAIVIKNIDGGTGTFLKQLLKIGKPAGRISVLALEEPSFHTLGNLPVLFCRDKNNKQEPARLFSAIRILIKEWFFLARELHRMHPDVVIGIDTHCNLLVCLVKMFLPKAHLILTVHNNTSGVFHYKHHLFPVWLIRKSGNLLFRLARCMVGVSRGVVSDIRYNFDPAVPVHMVHYGIPPASRGCTCGVHRVERSDPPDDVRFPKNVPVIMTISRLAVQKDIRTLIHASVELFRRGVDHRLMIIGDGQERWELETIIRENQLQARIVLLGWKKCMDPYFSIASLFVLSTHYEGFPFVLLEAMAAGLPVVATDVDYGPAELLGQNEYGLLTRPNDAVDMADRLEFLLKNQSTREHYARQSLRRIQDFTEAAMLEEYRGIINSTLTTT